MIIRTLGTGSASAATGALGLGLLGMSGLYGPAEETESIATIEQAMPRDSAAGSRYDEGLMRMLDSDK